MRPLHPCVLAFAMAACAAPDDASDEQAAAVVGGEVDFKYVNVGLLMHDAGRCTATQLHGGLVVTAAHCLGPSLFYVPRPIATPQRLTGYPVVDVFIPATRDAEKRTDDLAILRLAGSSEPGELDDVSWPIQKRAPREVAGTRGGFSSVRSTCQWCPTSTSSPRSSS